MTASLLPLPDDPRLQALIDGWPEWELLPVWFPRSRWLTAFERILLVHYPDSSARDRSLTARHYAPFPLAAGHNVP